MYMEHKFFIPTFYTNWGIFKLKSYLYRYICFEAFGTYGQIELDHWHYIMWMNMQKVNQSLQLKILYLMTRTNLEKQFLQL